jgi:hypothetical protein
MDGRVRGSAVASANSFKKESLGALWMRRGFCAEVYQNAGHC